MASAFYSPAIFHKLRYILANHPIIVNFRWSPTDSYIATWTFLFSAVFLYVSTAVVLSTIMRFIRRIQVGGTSLGPIHVAHSFVVSVTSLIIFIGMLLSAVEEIQETRWLWHRIGTSNVIQWLLCFPLGTRPTGRVFFWSYVYYLSRFLHLLPTYLDILQNGGVSVFTLASQSIPLVSSFLWLEFSQSFQVVAILLTTSLNAVVYGYQFWTALGLSKVRFELVVNCQVVVVVCNLLCHVGVLAFHILKSGCNGIAAWGINAVLNGVILFVTIRFYFKNMYLSRQ